MTHDNKNEFQPDRRDQRAQCRGNRLLRAISRTPLATAPISRHSQTAQLASNRPLSKFRTTVADNKPLPLGFLIANPGLEIKLNDRKQSPLRFSNREEIAFFFGDPKRLVAVAGLSRSKGISPTAFLISRQSRKRRGRRRERRESGWIWAPVRGDRRDEGGENKHPTVT
jgi:hypothetical protein